VPKTPKQCRARWVSWLSYLLPPGVSNRTPWTPLEEAGFREAHAVVGDDWQMIASVLPGRSPRDVYFYSLRQQHMEQDAVAPGDVVAPST